MNINGLMYMSSKQNKQKAQKKARKQELVELEKHLLETQFPLECEALPIEELTSDEQVVVQKCINHEKLTDEEFKLLKKTLVQYREAINKHDAIHTVDNAEKLVTIIKTEQELIDIFNNPENMQLTVHLPYNNQIYEMVFDILPVTDSTVVHKLDDHLQLFKNFTEDEKQLFNKASSGKQLSREEELVMKRLEKKLEETASEQEDKIIEEFLENQLILHGSTADSKVRKEFWSKFSIIIKSQIFTRIQDRLGLTAVKNEELFPVG